MRGQPRAALALCIRWERDTCPTTSPKIAAQIAQLTGQSFVTAPNKFAAQGSLDEQEKRSYAQYQEQPTDLAKNIYMTALQDRNEVLFYRLLTDHLQEMLPIVYDPTVAQAIEQYSHEYRRPRGVYLSIDEPEAIETSLRDVGAGPDDIDLIVATDAEEILGIGDWGAASWTGIAARCAPSMMTCRGPARSRWQQSSPP